MERINDNAYKLDLQGEHNVSATFNVSDLTLFDAGTDSRSNPFQEGGDDMIQADNKPKDALQVPEGPITRQRTKRLREAMAGLVQSFTADCNKQIEMHVGFDGKGPKPFHLAQISLE